MAYEQRDNSGSLFQNERKERDTHPDLNGTVMIDGTEYWINAWHKTGKSGKEFLSLSFKRKDGITSSPSTIRDTKSSLPAAKRFPADRITSGGIRDQAMSKLNKPDNGDMGGDNIPF